MEEVPSLLKHMQGKAKGANNRTPLRAPKTTHMGKKRPTLQITFEIWVHGGSMQQYTFVRGPRGASMQC